VPLRVLLVDDVPELRAELARALGLRGHFTISGEAGDGRSAVVLARRHQPDLIVLDLGLPDLAGRDVLTELRACAPDALVVVYSGSHTPDRAAITQSVEAYVDKTQDIDYLADLLDDIGNRIPRSATMRLGPDARDVASARQFVVDRCTEWGRPSVADDAAIVVSELVSNALVHVRSSCELTIGLRGDVLRLDVVDHAGGMPDLQAATDSDEHGRGLLLVSMLCAAWGSEPRDDGKIVWAELRAEASPLDLRPPRREDGAGAAGTVHSADRADPLAGLGRLDPPAGPAPRSPRAAVRSR
jgi:CheY-like chemotaxis protein